MSIDLVPQFICSNYEIREWKHATTILHGDFPNECTGIIETLTEFRLLKKWIIVGGGRKSKIASRIDNKLIAERIWAHHADKARQILEQG